LLMTNVKKHFLHSRFMQYIVKTINILLILVAKKIKRPTVFRQ
jgi:hypothetical protein